MPVESSPNRAGSTPITSGPTTSPMRHLRARSTSFAGMTPSAGRHYRDVVDLREQGRVERDVVLVPQDQLQGVFAGRQLDPVLGLPRPVVPVVLVVRDHIVHVDRRRV